MIRNQWSYGGSYAGAEPQWAPSIAKHAVPGSPAEFRSKMNGGLQELDETAYWIELLVESDRVPVARIADLMQEAEEIAIFVTSIETSREGDT